MGFCFYCGMQVVEDKQVSFHKFPTDDMLLKKWIQNMGQSEEWVPKKRQTLCSAHFTSDCFIIHENRKTLKIGSFPTIFREWNGKEIGDNNIEKDVSDLQSSPVAREQCLTNWLPLEHPHTPSTSSDTAGFKSNHLDFTSVTKVCCTCLAYNVELFPLTDDDIRRCLEEVTDIKIKLEEESMQNVCAQCVSLMRKFVEFKHKCYKAHREWREIISQSTHISEALLEEESKKLNSVANISPNDDPDTNLVKAEILLIDESDLNHNFEQMSGSFELQSNLDNINSFEKNLLSFETDQYDQNEPYENDLNQAEKHDSDEAEKYNSDEVENYDSDVEEKHDSDEAEKYDYDEENHDSDEARKYDSYETEKHFTDDAIKYYSDGAQNYDSDVAEIHDSNEAEKYDSDEAENHDSDEAKKYDFDESEKHVTDYAAKYYSDEAQNYDPDEAEKRDSDEAEKQISHEADEVDSDKTNQYDSVILDHNYISSVDKAKAKTLAKKKSRAPLNENTLLVKRQNSLRKFDYIVPVSITEEQPREETWRRETSESYLNAAFKCTHCVTGFASQVTYDQHMELHHEGRVALECVTCKLRFHHMSRLRRHQVTAHRMRFKCLICKQIFDEMKKVMSHYKREHQGIMHLQCKVCQEKFKEKNVYSSHIHTAHPTENVCDRCGYYFTSRSRLEVHQKQKKTDCKERSKSIFECGMCDARLLKPYSWYCHMVGHRKENEQNPPTKCQICGHKTTSWSTWSIHFLAEHRVKNVNSDNSSDTRRRFICDVCGHMTATKALLTEHICKYHTDNYVPRKNIRWYDTCEFCHKKMSRTNMKRHMITHTGEKPYKCDVCGKTFTQAWNRDAHHGTAHRIFKTPSATQKVSSQQRDFHCDLCARTFSSKQTLKMHDQMLHVGENPYPCDSCPRAFTTERGLKLHTYIHTGDAPFPCDVCQASFATKRNLEKHKYIHTGKKPFPCDTCRASFTTKYQLDHHKYTHTGEKPYACDLCDKNFRNKGYLQIHKISHTVEKPYSCDICDKRFNFKKNLVRHTNMHTGVKKWTCDLCGKKFTQRWSMNSHKKTVHLKLPYPPRKPRQSKKK